ncbi:hypothetical protein SDC9_180925 [bioreactor metagenome]|uniref:Uncharacterized protein n=1 Tax=bioreactor metagenome TaxID=1076179 RepID=A0A645H336_9ZZZZ
MADKLAQIDETSISGVIDLKGQDYEPGTYTVPLGIKVPDSSLSGFIAVEGEYTITIEVVDK